MAIVYGSGLLSSTASILASEHGREVSMFARAYMEHPIGGASGVLKVAGKFQKAAVSFSFPNAAVKIGMPYKSTTEGFDGVHDFLMNPSGVNLFIEGGDSSTLNLYTSGGPLGSTFDSFIEGVGWDFENQTGPAQDQNRPYQELYIKGKGTEFNSSLNLFVDTPSIIDTKTGSVNSFIEGLLPQPTGAIADATLFIKNDFKKIQTSVAGPGNRGSDVPLFLKASRQKINTDMSMFIGPQRTPTKDMPLFIKTQEISASGTVDLSIMSKDSASGVLDLNIKGIGKRTSIKTLTITGR